MVGKAKTSISLDEQLWQEFRVNCIRKQKKYAQVIEELIQEWLKKP